MAGQGLADLLSGAAGAPVNRPALESFVANSQAKNGFVSAQTQEAMVKASQAQEQMAAWDGIKTRLIEMGAPESEATLARDAIVAANNHDPVTGLKTLGMAKLGYGNIQSQTAGQQIVQGKEAGPVATPANFQMPPGSPLASVPVQQSPQGAAQTADEQAQIKLRNAQADAGGFNPHTGARGALAGLDPDHYAALQRAIAEGRLDPARVNSRTAPIFAELETRNPGNTNFNRLTADAALQRNATFQQKAMGFEALPTVMQHMTSLGKKIGYSDWRTVGKMQQFLNGETNDPDYTEYMSVRNDALMNIASLMRGVGMSDQAHRAEMEAAAPTLSPLALDGWFKGQMSSLEPRLKQVQRVEHLGDRPNTSVGAPPLQAEPAAGATSTAAAAAPVSLDDYLKARGH